MRKDLYADLYQQEEKHWWHRSKRENCRRLLLKYLFDKNLKILDIGCGTGKNVEFFQEWGETFGLDASPEAIRFCQKRGLKNIKKARGEKTNFPAETFDLITLLDVLEHVDETAILAEIRRLLKPKGKLLITVPAYPWLWSRWDEVLKHRRRYTLSTLNAILKKHHFRVLKISYMFSFLLLPAILVRLIKSRLSGENYSSDFSLSSPLINFIGFKLAQLEGFILNQFSLPFGTSLICLAQKE